jgi:hypothetical protein
MADVAVITRCPCATVITTQFLLLNIDRENQKDFPIDCWNQQHHGIGMPVGNEEIKKDGRGHGGVDGRGEMMERLTM